MYRQWQGIHSGSKGEIYIIGFSRIHMILDNTRSTQERQYTSSE